VCWLARKGSGGYVGSRWACLIGSEAEGPRRWRGRGSPADALARLGDGVALLWT
jgi:hypothetical protein